MMPANPPQKAFSFAPNASFEGEFDPELLAPHPNKNEPNATLVTNLEALGILTP
jgi:hypothetical protein